MPRQRECQSHPDTSHGTSLVPRIQGFVDCWQQERGKPIYTLDP
jgi:hypothetical protein